MKKKNVILIIVLAVLSVFILGAIGIGLIIVISTKTVGSVVDDSKKNSFVSSYISIRKSVESKYSSGDTVSCDDNCSFMYKIDDRKYDLEVEDKITYFQIELETDQRIRLTQNDCEDLENTICIEDKIIGRIMK